MTTIAYKEGVIAYDSRATRGTLIDTDNMNKHIRHNETDYFYSGSLGDAELLIALDQGGAAEIKSGANAITVKSGQIRYVGMNPEDGYFSHTVDKNEPMAIGSGEDHALTAMDLGCSAKEAVKMAMKRDTCTGGKVRTYKVK